MCVCVCVCVCVCMCVCVYRFVYEHGIAFKLPFITCLYEVLKIRKLDLESVIGCFFSFFHFSLTRP